MTFPKTTFKFILYFARRYRFKFAAFFLIYIVWAINDALFPYFLKRIVDILQTYHQPPANVFQAVNSALIPLIALWVITEILMRAQGIIQIYTFPYFRAQIRSAVFDYVKFHSHQYFATHFAGNIAKKLADLPTSCSNLVEIILFQFVTPTAGSIIIFSMMLATHPLFAVILAVWLIIHLTLTILFLAHSNKLWNKHSETSAVLSGKIVDVFSNMLNVRLFARGNYEARYLKKYQRDEIAKSQAALWSIEFMRVGLGLNGLFLIFGMVLTLLYGWSQGWVTLGDFTQISMQTFWILGWIWYVSFQLTVFAREVAVVNNALSLVRKGHDMTDVPHAVPIIISKGEIAFEHVAFAYSNRRKLFRDLNVVIPAGQKVGLVGYSGSGKSTFVNLILRFYDIQSGRILLDKQDISQVTQDSLRAQIAMIPQDPMLFHRSLMENIRYGRLDATDEEVIAAAKLAHCHEFIEKLEDGYRGMVGERGIKLSGGQRQRIAIARAILKNAPLLILDEATSALDSVTEKLIQESLQHLMQNRTTLVVAHRLSTLADMDRILVFHKGKIIEDGTKQSLLAAQGHFAMLWEMQTNGFLPEGDNNISEKESI